MSARINLNGWTQMRFAGATVAVVALCGLALGIVALAGLDPTALCLLPALALVLPLLMRRYPGERVLAGLSRARRSRWSRSRLSATRTGRLCVVAPHGGLLIARSLAVRPPPALVAAS